VDVYVGQIRTNSIYLSKRPADSTDDDSVQKSMLANLVGPKVHFSKTSIQFQIGYQS
jgi:hypothetical protein